MSDKLKKSLEHIEVQSRSLIDLCEALKEQNDLLSLENQSLSVALETSIAAKKKLDERLGAMKLAMAVDATRGELTTLRHAGENASDPAEKNFDIKQKIDEFVREIDKCIILLNK